MVATPTLLPLQGLVEPDVHAHVQTKALMEAALKLLQEKAQTSAVETIDRGIGKHPGAAGTDVEQAALEIEKQQSEMPAPAKKAGRRVEQLA